MKVVDFFLFGMSADEVAQPPGSRKAVLHIAASRKFSSDRTIAAHARDLWHVEP